MADMKLSHTLIENGFFCALGTTEHPGLDPKGSLVKSDIPNRYDSNNGVLVIYDEHGWPWIALNKNKLYVAFEFDEMVKKYDMQRGAYVPHSNDGGQFVHRIMPELMGK